MGLLSREQILSSQDLDYRDVPVPKWGGDVRVRMLSAKERMALSDEFGEAVGGSKALAMLCKVIAVTAIDDNASPLFTLDDVEALAAKNWDCVKAVADAAMVLNGLSEEVVAEAEKNLETTPSDSTPSVSA